MAEQQFDADVVIVGSGALGSLAAWSLASAGKSVIVLEAGPRMERWQIVERFRNNPDKQNYNRPYPEQAWAPKSYGGRYSDDYLENTGSFEFKPGMLRLVGGTTWHWAAAAWRYLPNDMKLHSTYGVGRDWPIGYDDLEPWYQRAEEAMGVCGSDTDDQSGRGGKAYPPRSSPYPMPRLGWSTYTQAFAKKVRAAGYHFIDEPQARTSRTYDGRPPCAGNNNCMPVCPIAAMYSGDIHARKAEAAGARIIPNAVVFKLEKGDGGKIVAVHYKSPDGQETRLSARYVVVAAHGIETPKLLLLSDIANSSDQVGRNLMDHTGIGLSFLSKEALWPGRGPVQQGGVFDWRDGPFRARHSAVKHSLGNAVPNLEVADRLIARGLMGHGLDEQIRHDAARWVSISTVFEMLPHPKNRVTLSSNTDALGLPKPSIHYDVDDYVKNGSTVAKRDFKRFVALFDGTVIENETGWQNRDHIMGTVIMGSDPKNSVVDGNCRTHDHANLFLATTGVIPASGVVNPTLTGAALSLRLADTIRREL